MTFDLYSVSMQVGQQRNYYLNQIYILIPNVVNKVKPCAHFMSRSHELNSFQTPLKVILTVMMYSKTILGILPWHL